MHFLFLFLFCGGSMLTVDKRTEARVSIQKSNLMKAMRFYPELAYHFTCCRTS
uniref:Uncharacterized protein n=1 Tax=Octopus bimaculoides TaxID=37653 RepID=A0A0L8FVD6_OCTBM